MIARQFIVVGVILAACPALAENRDTKFQPLGEALNRYRLCVMKSAMRQGRLGMDPNVVAESAFQACTTEEQALNGMIVRFADDRTFAQDQTVALKIRLKEEIRQGFEMAEQEMKRRK